MPLPETLPKSSARKRATDRKPDASLSKHSVGASTQAESSVFTIQSSLFRSYLSSVESTVETATNPLSRNSYYDDQDDVETTTHAVDDESLMAWSWMTNSIISHGTDTLSMTLSESEATSASEFSHLYEPKIIQQRQVATSKLQRDTTKNELLPDIAEEHSMEDAIVEKPVSSWKRLFKRHRKDKAKKPKSDQEDLSKRDEFPPFGQPGSTKAIGDHSQSSFTQLEVKCLEEDNSRTTERTARPMQTKNEVDISTGWFAVSAWFSSEESEQPKYGEVDNKQSVNQYPQDQGNQDQSPNEPIVRSSSSEAQHVDNPLVAVEHKVEPQTDSVPEESDFKRRRNIPSILPFPIPYTASKKGEAIRRSQMEQRQRILSILESEDQSMGQGYNKKGQTETTKLEKSEMQSSNVCPVASNESLVESSDSNVEISNPTESTLSKAASHRWVSSGRPKRLESSADAEVTNECKMDAHDTEMEPYFGPFKGENQQEKSLGKDHLRNIVTNVKAQRLIKQSRKNHFRRKFDEIQHNALTNPSDEMCANSVDETRASEDDALGPKENTGDTGGKSFSPILDNHQLCQILSKIHGNHNGNDDKPVPATNKQHEEYLGKKTSRNSILEEKRMLKVMDQIVKRRLQVLEELEKDGYEEREGEIASCSLCGFLTDF